MYGTVAWMKVKPGKLDEFIAYMKEFANQRQPKGHIGEYIYQLDKDANQVLMAVLFQDKAAYHANANDPEMDKEFRRYREFLTDDPAWNDGEIIYTSMK